MSLIKSVYREITSSSIPISTPQLILLCAFDRPNARAQVWSVLRELVKLGLIKRAGQRKDKVFNRVTHKGTEVISNYTVTAWEKA